MRDTEANFWMVQTTSLTRAMRFAAIALGVGLVMAAGPVRAADDEDEDDRTFEEKIIGNIMSGLGGTNMENKGIDYRERSPLVVPPKLDLPPPAGTSAAVNAPNWPKDPDEARRKAAIAARKKENKDPALSARALTPAELNVGRTAAPARTNNDPVQPGTNQQQPDPEPIAARLRRRLVRHVQRQQGRDGGVQGRAAATVADRASGRIPDALAELCLRHRAEGIAEQGIRRHDGKER